MSLMDGVLEWAGKVSSNLLRKLVPGENIPFSSERGFRTTLENRMRYQTSLYQVDSDLRASIYDIRRMHRLDTRVRRIHDRVAKELIKGGLRIKTPTSNTKLIKRWNTFEQRLTLHRREKLESDARGMIMEGNLPMQWVLDTDQKQVMAGIRYPTETIVPLTDKSGKFLNCQAAYRQLNETNQEVATFPLWAMNLARLSPENYDDFGSLGRPILDSARTVWQKLIACEDSVPTRRLTRAHLRLAHIFQNAKPDDIKAYRSEIENSIGDIRTDYYSSNATITPIQGDTTLSDMGDIVHLLETFMVASPLPKALLYPTGVARDTVEGLKAEFYEDLDSLQDILAFIYEMGFRLDLLLSGVNPDAYDFSIIFAERRADSPNLRADLALKYQAIGVPKTMIWETAGLDAFEVAEQIRAEQASTDPYPNPTQIAMPQVNITPGNAPMGESSTTITTRG